jgi:hypothetical protein
MMVPMRIYRHTEHLAEIDVYGIGRIALNLTDKVLCPVHHNGSLRLAHNIWDSANEAAKLMAAIEALADETFPMLVDMPWLWEVTVGQVYEENN